MNDWNEFRKNQKIIKWKLIKYVVCTISKTLEDGRLWDRWDGRLWDEMVDCETDNWSLIFSKLLQERKIINIIF